MVSVDNIEMERFTAADSKAGRLASVYKPAKDNIAAAAARPATVVYGKSKVPRPGPAYIAPNLKPKASQKFKPSQEDSGYEPEAYNQYAQGYKQSAQENAALQKYMQKYASQVFAAQKHAAQYSEAQKAVVANDPYKKYLASAPTKYKFVPVTEGKISGERVKDHDTVEIATEKYQTYQLHSQIPVQAAKAQKSPPKKVYSYDSSHQSTEHKYSSQDTSSSALDASDDKEMWSAYEPYQSYGHYGVMTAEKSSELSKITGYKIPHAVSVSTGHSLDTKEESKDHHEEEHYPHHEPKYEYMYQVHDHEKHNNFGHSEARKGKTTWGKYYVQLPDGRLETVKYWVDKSGYHAEVDFKGEAKHPSQKEYTHHDSHQDTHHVTHHEHHEETPKSYIKGFELGLGGHSEAGYSLGEPGEEY